MAEDGRPLTGGEIAILQTLFKAKITYSEVRVFPRRWSWPFPNDRAMAPNGNIYFPGEDYEADFAKAGVPLGKRSVFVHESTHLYQWYGLRQMVWLRGPFDRNYEYTLVEGQAFEDYGLEQMAMIAQHYYMLRSGGTVRTVPYVLADYASLLPVQ